MRWPNPIEPGDYPDSKRESLPSLLVIVVLVPRSSDANRGDAPAHYCQGSVRRKGDLLHVADLQRGAAVDLGMLPRGRSIKSLYRLDAAAYHVGHPQQPAKRDRGGAKAQRWRSHKQQA